MGRAFIDSTRQGAADWYRTVGCEVTGGNVGGQNFPVNAVHLVNNINFLGLLNAINQFAQTGETIVTVHHGTTVGFRMRLVPNPSCQIFAEIQALRDLMSEIPDDQLGIPNVSTQEVSEIRRLRSEIRRKRLAGIEIRACNMGDYTTLGVIRDFFGAGYVAAPIVTDFFEPIPRYNQAQPANLQTYSTRQNYRCFAPQPVAGQAAPPDLCVYFQPRGGSAYEIGVYTIQDRAPRTRWMRENFAVGNSFTPPPNWLSGGFCVHGVVLSNVLRFPAEPAYRNNIQVHSGSII